LLITAISLRQFPLSSSATRLATPWMRVVLVWKELDLSFSSNFFFLLCSAPAISETGGFILFSLETT
jgi:hypothetical protein